MPNDRGFLQPWAMADDPASGNRFTVHDARTIIGGLLGGGPVDRQVRQGVLPSSMTGGVAPDLPPDLYVYALAGQVLVSVVYRGLAVVSRGAAHGAYIAGTTEFVQREHPPADATSPRIDCVVLRMTEPGVHGELGAVNRTSDIVVIPGTPSSIPTPPTEQVIAGRDLLLSTVHIPAGATQLSSSSHTDRRLFTCARGGVFLRSSWDTRPGSYPGELSFNARAAVVEMWANDTWTPLGGGSWTEFTPEVHTIANGRVPAAQIQSVAGRWRRTGGDIQIDCLIVPIRNANWGYGEVRIELPPPIKVPSNRFSTIIGDARFDAIYDGGHRFFGFAERVTDSTVNVSFPLGSNTPYSSDPIESFPWSVAMSSSRAAGSGIPRVPGRTSEGRVQVRIRASF